MQNETYTRVIPRDFFNEAKLLKCMGILSLKILDSQLPEGIEIEIEENYDPFEVNLTDDGILFVSNYNVVINGTPVFVGTRYNSKSNLPFVLVVDYTEYEIFSEEGKFTDEFIEIAKTL